jgi:transposase-like protein
MNRRTRPTYSPEFRLEAAQLVVNQGRYIRVAAEAMGLVNPPWKNGFASFGKSIMIFRHKRHQ